jgi:hypothetical protein
MQEAKVINGGGTKILEPASRRKFAGACPSTVGK